MNRAGETYGMAGLAQRLKACGLAVLTMCWSLCVTGWGSLSAALTNVGSNASESVTRDAVASVSRPQPVVAVEQSSNARPVWELQQRFNQQGGSSDRSRVPCASSWEIDLPVDLNTIGKYTDGQAPARGVSDGAFKSLPKDGVWPGPASNTAAQEESSAVDGQLSTNTTSAAENAEDDQSPQPTSLLEAGLAPKRLREREVCTQSSKSRSRANRSVRSRPSIPSSEADAIASFMRNRTTAWNAKGQRVMDGRVAKLRFQRRSHREGTEVEAQGPQRSASGEAMIDSNAEADGHMILEADDLIVGLMAGLKISEEDDAGDVDEVMIGSDVDGEMEVDEETPGSDDEPMQLGQDSPRRRYSPKKGPQRQRGKVSYGRISREKVAIPLRERVSGAVAVSAGQSSQQQAVPFSVSVVASTDVSSQPPVAHGPVPANSAADLREARLGKKPEVKAVQDEAAGRPLLPQTASSEEAVTKDEQKSDTTEPTTTPTSTPPSSLPTSPLPQDPAHTRQSSPKPATNTFAPQQRKRGCDKSIASKRERLAKPTKRSPSPTQASKRVQQRRAADEQEVIPLNDVAGQTPSKEEIQQQVLTAQMDMAPDSDTDLDWSEEEEGPKGGKAKGKAGKGNGKAKGKGKEGK